MSGLAQSARERHGNDHIVLLLSLKLILLAFFILLNALSEFEADRTRAVLESVNRAFSGKLETAKGTAAPGGSAGMLPEAEALLSEVGSLFESIIPSVRSKRSRRTTSLRVDMPEATLFEPGDWRLRPARRALIRRLAKALVHGHGGGPAYELEVLHGIGVSADAAGEPAGAASRSLEVRRTAVLAHRLLNAGLAPEALAIGVLPGQPGTVRFVLRVHEPTEPPAGPGDVVEQGG